MNILMVSNRSSYYRSAFGGAEISMRLLSEMLARNYHEVFYLTKRFDLKYRIRYIKEKINNVSVISINYANSTKMKSMRKHNLMNYILRLYNQNQSRIFSKRLSQIAIKNEIKIIYCFYELNILNKLIDLKERAVPVKIVMRMAGNHWYEQCKINAKLIPAFERAFNAIDSINFIHEGMVKDFETQCDELHINVKLKHYFIGDIGTAAPSIRPKPYSENINQFQMIMAARFSDYQKRQDILVKAMSLIPNTLPIKLTLIGEGTQKETINQLIIQYKLTDRVIIEPFCEQTELWNKLISSQLLCHACDYEGVSKIIIESQSFGLPVLASDVPPLKDAIQEQHNGFLVKNTPEEWAKKIIWLYQNQDKLTHVSRICLNENKQKNNPEKNVILYEKAFNDIIANIGLTEPL